MKKNLFLILCVLTAAYAFSENIPLKLTRAGAVAFALENSAELRAVRANIDAARGRLENSGLLSNPTLDADYGNDFAFKGKGAYDFKVGIAQKFPLGGRLASERDIGAVDVEMAKLEYEQARLKTARDVELAFVDALEKREALTETSKNTELAKKLLELTESSFKRGMASGIDVGLARTRFEQAQIRRVESEAQYESALFTLKEFVGTAREIQPSGEIEREKISAAGFSQSVLDLRPDYRVYALAQKNVQAQIALIKAKRFDEIEVGLFYTSSRDYEDAGGKTDYEALGVAVSIPLPFNSYSGSINEQTAMRRRAEALATAKEISIKNQIRIYRARAERYSKMLDIFDTSHKEAFTQTSSQIEAAYLKGEAAADLLLRFRDSFLDSKLKRLECAAMQMKSAIDLKYALGEKNLNSNSRKAIDNEK